MPADLAHYTITGAQDWPMFKEMLAGMRILIGLFWASIAIGGAAGWRDLRKGIAGRRKEDKETCARCQKLRDAEFKYVWDALDVCCPRSPEAKKAVIAAKARLEATASCSPGGTE